MVCLNWFVSSKSQIVVGLYNFHDIWSGLKPVKIVTCFYFIFSYCENSGLITAESTKFFTVVILKCIMPSF